MASPLPLSSGGAKVYTVTISGANGTEVRGEQLLSQVRQILAVTGAAKVNLIGHSHGGPTARYVASVRPDLVASVTSVAGVNKGSKVADVLAGTAPNAGSALGDALASLIGILSGNKGLPRNAGAAMASLSTAGSLAFNSSHPHGVPTTACGEGAYQERGVYALVVDAELGYLFDYYLAGLGEKPLAAIRSQIELELDRRLMPAPAREAKRLLGAYLAYQQALAGIEPHLRPSGDALRAVEAARARLQAKRALRAVQFLRPVCNLVSLVHIESGEVRATGRVAARYAAVDDAP